MSKQWHGLYEMEAYTSHNLSLREGNHIRNSRLLTFRCTPHHMAAGLLRILLLIAGIEPNPGPKTWRCSVCSHVLAKNTTSVQCNGCYHWCHLRRCSDLQSHLDWTTKYKAPCCPAASNALPRCFPAQIRSKCDNPGDDDNTKFVGEENMHIDPESSPYLTATSDYDPVAINIENGVDVKENPDAQFIENHKLKIAKVVLQRVDSIYYTAGSERTNLYDSKLKSYIKVEDGLRPVDMVSDDTSESRENSTFNFIKDEPLDLIDECSIKQEPPIAPHCHSPLAMPSSTGEFTNLSAVSANNEELPTDGRDSSIDPSSATVGSKICDLCGDIFRSLPLVKKHIVEEHLAVELHDKLISDAKSNEFRLSERGKSFTRKSCLKQHFILLNGEKPYHCSECGKIFMKKNVLMTHLRTHTIEKPFGCTECGKAFAQKSYLQAHYRHTGEKPYKCAECGKKYREKWYLTIHQGVHSGEQSLVCSQCDRAFATKSSLAVHLRIHTGEKPFECTECGKRCRNKCDLTKSHACIQCGKAFARKEQLTQHLHSHSSEKSYECSQCGKAFTIKSSMNRHLRSHGGGEKSHACAECGKVVYHKSSMNRHIRSHSDVKLFECTQCGKTFTEQSSMDRHFRSHTGEKSFECTECGKTFADRSSLYKHRRIHSGEKPHVCSQCGRAFAQKITMVRHVRSHTGEKPFECTKCGRKFAQEGLLIYHLRVHSGEKPYECSHCGNGFTQKVNMDRHSRLHSGDKPFECTECGRAFSRKSSMMFHLRVHAGEKPYARTQL